MYVMYSISVHIATLRAQGLPVLIMLLLAECTRVRHVKYQRTHRNTAGPGVASIDHVATSTVYTCTSCKA